MKKKEKGKTGSLARLLGPLPENFIQGWLRSLLMMIWTVSLQPRNGSQHLLTIGVSPDTPDYHNVLLLLFDWKRSQIELEGVPASLR